MGSVSAWVKRFDALAQRERVLLLCAALCAVLALAYAGVVDPALSQAKRVRIHLGELRSQLQLLHASKTELERQLTHDVNAEIKRNLERAKGEASVLEARIKQFHQSLIPAQEMAKVVSGLLARESQVHLISLRNLTPEPVALDKGEQTPAHAMSSHPQAKPLLYKHGIDLVVEGGYFDLLQYLSDLEAQPWRLIWAETSLSAEHPKARLRLKVYTLSLDPVWLSV